jgi:DNA-binding CsgD family transcriptional regulator
MKPDIQLMHTVWDGLVTGNRQSTDLPKRNFDELISSVFAAGPFYFYIIDFFDMSISNISSGFKNAHGIEPESIKTINDILSLVHPDDMAFVSEAEKKAFGFIYESIGADKITRYKESYNLRFKTAEGDYQLFNHQSVILTADENGNFIKSLNIHTNINHITKRNNFKFSLIGLEGEPSFLNMNVFEDQDSKEADSTSEHSFSKKELEIIKWIAKGKETKEIAEKLFVAIDTIKTHRKNILKKSGCSNSAELIARSMSEGWI